MTPEFPTDNVSSPTNVSKSIANPSWPQPQEDSKKSRLASAVSTNRKPV